MTLQIKTSEALDYERLDWLCSELRTASREFSGATEMADNLLNFCVEHHYGSRDVPELIINRVINLTMIIKTVVAATITITISIIANTLAAQAAGSSRGID